MRSAPAYPKQVLLRALRSEKGAWHTRLKTHPLVVKNLGAFFAVEPQKTGLSAPIPQTLPQVKSVTYGNSCGISNKQIHKVDLQPIPFAEHPVAERANLRQTSLRRVLNQTLRIKI
jgi:hypothetical protein